MTDVFQLTDDNGTTNLGIHTALIKFSHEYDAWRVGLEITSEANEEYDEITLHLKDVLVKAVDARAETLRIVMPRDDADDRRTNLYNGGHNRTQNNLIEVQAVGDGRFRVRWSGKGDLFADCFEVTCLAKEVREIDYPI